ncbi:unnamed protein product, partial [marine sediment metagenome]
YDNNQLYFDNNQQNINNITNNQINWDNNQMNWDNNQMNWDNNQMNWDNNQMNWDNCQSSFDNNSDNKCDICNYNYDSNNYFEDIIKDIDGDIVMQDVCDNKNNKISDIFDRINNENNNLLDDKKISSTYATNQPTKKPTLFSSNNYDNYTNKVIIPNNKDDLSLIKNIPPIKIHSSFSKSSQITYLPPTMPLSFQLPPLPPLSQPSSLSPSPPSPPSPPPPPLPM